MYPPQSPTRMTNNSILKLAGAFHCVNTSRIRFWAFSYSMGEPCGRSDQVSMYFIKCLRWVDSRFAVVARLERDWGADARLVEDCQPWASPQDLLHGLPL